MKTGRRLMGLAYVVASVGGAAAVLAPAWAFGVFGGDAANAKPRRAEWVYNVATDCLHTQPRPAVFARCLRDGVNAEHAHRQGPFVVSAITCRSGGKERTYVCGAEGAVRGYHVCVRQLYRWRPATWYGKALVYVRGGLVPCAAVRPSTVMPEDGA